METPMSKKQQQHTQDDPEQSKRFIEAARKAEADESEDGADRAFKKAVKDKAQSPKRNKL
jgi:hypothetical protein